MNKMWYPKSINKPVHAIVIIPLTELTLTGEIKATSEIKKGKILKLKLCKRCVTKIKRGKYCFICRADVDRERNTVTYYTNVRK